MVNNRDILIDRAEWITIAKAAKKLGVGISTVHFWVATGRLSYIQSGGPGTMILVSLRELRKKASPKLAQT